MIEVIDIKTKMRNDLEAAGIDANKYLQSSEVIEAVHSHTGLYLLQPGGRLNFVFSRPIWLDPGNVNYRLLAKVRFEPVGNGWRGIEIWEGNISRSSCGGANMPQISASAEFSPGKKLDQTAIIISQDTDQDLDVYLEATIEILQEENREMS